MAITDLTNTKWNIPAGWTASAGYGQFNIDLYFDDDDNYEFYSIYIGYGLSGVPGDFTYPSTSNSIVFNGSSWSTYTSTSSFTITITGGSDVTNPDLISWLEDNGTQVIEELSSKETYFSIMSELAQTIAEKTGAELPLSIDEMIDALAPKKYTVTVKTYMENAGANIFETYLSANGESLYVDCDTRLYHNGTEVTSKEYILNDVEEVVISRQGAFAAYKIDNGYPVFLDGGVFGGLDVNSVTIPITKDTVIYIGGGD